MKKSHADVVRHADAISGLAIIAGESLEHLNFMENPSAPITERCTAEIRYSQSSPMRHLVDCEQGDAEVTQTRMSWHSHRQITPLWSASKQCFDIMNENMIHDLGL